MLMCNKKKMSAPSADITRGRPATCRAPQTLTVNQQGLIILNMRIAF